MRRLAYAGLLALGACRGAGDRLEVANGPDPMVLDPQLASTTAEGRILAALCCGLTRLDPGTLAAQPALAQTWSSAEGGRSWSFVLRPGLEWSDGSPLTAADFVASWTRLLQPGTGAPYRAWLTALEGADAGGPEPPAGLHADGLLLDVRFRYPVPAFDQMCAYHALAPLAPAARRAPPGEPAPMDIGCGPYRLVERRVRDRVRVERNPRYYDAAGVAIPSIEFLTTDSLLAALNLFLAGAADYAPDVPTLAIPALAARARAAPPGAAVPYAPAPYFGTEFYRINCRRGPLQDARVRAALSLALDREALAATVGGGQPAALSFTPPLCPPYQPPLVCRRDPERAAALLAEAGYPGGAGFPRLQLLFPSGETQRDAAEAAQDQWRRTLGIEIGLDLQESSAARAAVRRGDYDLARASWIGDYLDPTTFLDVFRPDSEQNLTGWRDSQYESLLDDARAQPDPQKRDELLRAAETRLLEQAPLLPLFHYVTHELVAARVRGFTRNSRQYVDWARLSLAE